MRLLRILRKEWKTSLLVFLLLFGQAMFELALPGYTSSLVDVGIQRSGIDSPSPDYLSARSRDSLRGMLSPQQQEIFDKAYLLTDGLYVLQTKAGDERKQLDDMLLMPAALLGMAQLPQGEGMQGMLTQLRQSGLSMQEIQTRAQTMLGGMGGDAALEQAAASFVESEYKQLNIDVNGLRNAYLLRTGGIMLLITLLMGALAASVSFFASRTSSRISRGLRRDVFGRVMAFSSTEVEKFSAASLITRTTNDIQQVEQGLMMTMRIVFYAPILGIGGVLRVSSTNTGLGWIIFVAVGLIMALMAVMAFVVVPRFRLMQKLTDRLNQVGREILTGLNVIRAFTREDFERERYDQASKGLAGNMLFVQRSFSTLMPAMMLVMNVISILIVWFGAGSIDKGTLQVGEMMAFISYTMQIVSSFMMLSMTAVFLPRANVALERLQEVLDTPSSIQSPDSPVPMPEEVRGEITFHDVSFRYPDAEEDSIQHVSFTARPGETVAFIGGTGSGKSTILNLIPRFFDVTQGKITLDDTDIRQFDIHQLREKIGFVPQKSQLFTGTVEDNIKFSDPLMPDNNMISAARIAQAQEFIDKMEQGYQSPISRGGSNVSGGQKQRLSIARALAGEPQVLLFDDSFSALDFITDAKLRKALEAQRQNATVLVVAQRISTVLHADRIVVLDAGQVVAQGTHEELMRGSDVYRQIASSQLKTEELSLKDSDVGEGE